LHRERGEREKLDAPPVDFAALSHLRPYSMSRKVSINCGKMKACPSELSLTLTRIDGHQFAATAEIMDDVVKLSSGVDNYKFKLSNHVTGEDSSLKGHSEASKAEAEAFDTAHSSKTKEHARPLQSMLSGKKMKNSPVTRRKTL
jgi:hypothetical protein